MRAEAFQGRSRAQSCYHRAAALLPGPADRSGVRSAVDPYPALDGVRVGSGMETLCPSDGPVGESGTRAAALAAATAAAAAAAACESLICRAIVKGRSRFGRVAGGGGDATGTDSDATAPDETEAAAEPADALDNCAAVVGCAPPLLMSADMAMGVSST
jgi:hypothetical protein